MKIKFGDLKIGLTAKKYLSRATDSNHVTEGPITKEFKDKFSGKILSKLS